ncbi:MAG: glycosyltransferase [Phycisphaerae bacterium]
MIQQMAEARTIYLAGGGSGGHLYPGLSVAQVLRARGVDADIVFLCTRRDIDRTILEPTGFEFIEQPILPPRRSIGGLLKFWRSWRATQDLLRETTEKRPPAVMLGLGGYAAGVALKRAAQQRVPTALINPDVVPGKANLYLMKDAAKVCCQFEQTRQHVPAAVREKLEITGCPVRGDILTRPDRETALKKLNLDPLLRTLVITGASQGASTVNEAVVESLKQQKLQGWQVYHLAGRDHAEAVRADYRAAGMRATVVDFTPEMATVWAAADLTITRAGASTCAEVIACGVPAIFMPYPFHKDMHQLANAKVLADAGAAIVIDDRKDRRQNAEQLKPALEQVLYDAARRQRMSAAARTVAPHDAAERVADVVSSLLENGR